MIIYLFFSSADVHENSSSFWKHYCFGLVFPLFLPRTWVLKAKYNLLMWHPPLSLEDDTCRNRSHFISSQNYITLPSLRGQYPYPISTVSIPRYSLILYLNQRDKKDSSAAKKFPPILSSIGRALQNHFIHNSSHISWDSCDILCSFLRWHHRITKFSIGREEAQLLYKPEYQYRMGCLLNLTWREL